MCESGRAPEVAMMVYAPGSFQIHANIRSDRFGVWSLEEDTYMRMLSVYFDGTADDTNRVPAPFFASLDPLRRTTGEDDSVTTRDTLPWYARSISMRLVALTRDY